MLGSINSEQAKFKQALEQEHANQKVVEQSFTFTKKIFILIKRKVHQLEGQNESLIKIAHK